MRKYFFIFKTELMSNLQYIFNIVTGVIGCFIFLFVFLYLWKYIYSDPNELINGYSMNQMIWYVIITEILWISLGGRKLCKKIADDVRGGNIAYNINKPYNYIGYSLATHLGDVSLKFATYALLGMLTGFIFLGSFPTLNLLQILGIILSAILAIIINTLLITAIGLFSFYIEDANPFYWLYSKLILVVGTIFPIEYFPNSIQPILTYSPVFAVSYAPAKLFVDFSTSTFLKVIIIQLIYLITSYLVCIFIYKKGVKKLNVNGG